MAPLRILITGAGIGGSALAFWLAKIGHDVTVIERHPFLRVNGLQLDLRGYGIQVMKLMGLEQAVRAKLVPEEGWALVDSTGRQRAWFPANKSGKGAQSMTSDYEIMRCDLCEILHDSATENGAKYVFGKYLESYEEQDGVVNVKFNDESTETYDLVVGADGLASRLRRLMFDEKEVGAKKSLVDLPERTAYFTIPKPIEDGERYIATGYVLTNKRFVLTRRHSPKTMQVYLMCETKTDAMKAMRRGDIASEKAAFAEMFRGAGGETDQLVQAFQEGAEDWYCQYSGFVKLDKWSRGHVVLLGDAAHGAPADGKGTSAALIGAYILAGEIQRHCSSTIDKSESEVGGLEQKDGLLNALQEYERIYQPYMKESHKYLSAEPSIFDNIPWNRLTVELLLCLAWFVSFIRLDLLLMRFFEDGGVKGFKLPDYAMAER